MANGSQTENRKLLLAELSSTFGNYCVLDHIPLSDKIMLIDGYENIISELLSRIEDRANLPTDHEFLKNIQAEYQELIRPNQVKSRFHLALVKLKKTHSHIVTWKNMLETLYKYQHFDIIDDLISSELREKWNELSRMNTRSPEAIDNSIQSCQPENTTQSALVISREAEESDEVLSTVSNSISTPTVDHQISTTDCPNSIGSTNLEIRSSIRESLLFIGRQVTYEIGRGVGTVFWMAFQQILQRYLP